MRRQTLLLYLILATVPLGVIGSVHAANNTPSDRAAAWLLSHLYPNGTYGAYLEHEAASSAYALYLYQGNSSAVNNTLGTLKSAMENKNWWFWDPQFGEADVPGLILYVFAQTHHIGNMNLTRVVPLLSAFRNTTSGGYRGYYGAPYDSVNTLYAMLGLLGSNSLSNQNLNQTVNYLSSLQVQSGPLKGAFNMTSTIANSSLQSLAPDVLSQTAAVTLSLQNALKQAAKAGSVTIVKQLINQAIALLKAGAAQVKMKLQSLAASLSSLALSGWNDTSSAQGFRTALVSMQHQDGGFVDSSRSNSTASNPLDTAWALIALQEVPSPLLSSLPEGLSFLVLMLGILVLTATRRLRPVSSSRRQESLLQ